MKKSVLVLMALLFIGPVFAQEEEKTDQKEETKDKGFKRENVFVGGGLSLSLGTGSYTKSFLIGVNPMIGYSISPRWFDAGVVLNYEYISQRSSGYTGYDDKYRYSLYGTGVFARFYPLHFIFLQAQPEYNFIRQKTITANDSYITKYNVASFLVGGGIKTSLNEGNTFTYIVLLFDIAKNDRSPYVYPNGDAVPMIRAGVNIGLGPGKKRR